MSTENTNETEATAELAKPEDVTAYIEEREEQIAEEAPPEDAEDRAIKELREKHPELKEARKASRYERLKRARDQYKAEAEELRHKYEGSEQREAYSSDTPIEREDTSPEGQKRLEGSLESAKHMYGDAFDKAYNAFVDHAHRTRDAAAYQRIMNSADPGAELVQWHNEQGNPEAPELTPGSLESEIQRGNPTAASRS